MFSGQSHHWVIPAQKVLFRNWGPDDAACMSRIPVWVALRATTAAPLYFPCIHFNGHHYIDGGLGGNNPVMEATRQAEALWGLHSVTVVCSIGTGQFPRRRNTYLRAEMAGRSLLGSMSGTGMFSRLVSTAVSAGSTVGLITMLGDLAVAVDEQHEMAALLYRGMPDVFYTRWDPAISAIELDCTDEKQLDELELSMLQLTLGEQRMLFEHLIVLLLN